MKRKHANTSDKTGLCAKRHLQYSSLMSRTLSDCSEGDGSGASTALSTPIGEVLLSDFNVNELPSESSEETALDTSGISVIVHTALIARIEALEIENKALQHQVSSKSKPFRLSVILYSDSLVHFYTGC